ncbi:MAG: hypothetical protein Q9M22_03175 [Mariprofundaceae bacterium]|nr:hypothetical protein [Mariprofundaceae bacterium]
MRHIFINGGLMIALTFLFVSCGGDSQQPVASNTSVASSLYTGIITAMNDTERRIPDNFYNVQQNHSGVEHDYFHINTVDVWPASTVNYNLATSDPNVAIGWMRSVVATRYNNPSFVSTLENNWYYESTWYADDPYAGHPHYISARVFKAIAIDRSMYDLNQPSPLQAVLQQLPATASDIHFIAEYLWTYSTSNNTGHVVLDSTTEASTLGFRQRIREAVFTPVQSTTECLPVQLWDTYYELNNTTGSIVLTRTYRGDFLARFISGQGYIVCPDHTPQVSTSDGITAQGIHAVYPE